MRSPTAYGDAYMARTFAHWLGHSTRWIGTALLACTSAQAATLQVDMTVDNVYALYTGTHDVAQRFVAYDGDWRSAETFRFELPRESYIYVAAYSDDWTAQGMLAQFTNLATGRRFYSHDPQWQVSATGLNKGLQDLPPTLSELTDQIRLANRGASASRGWVAPTVGPPNAGVLPWGHVTGIDSSARWTWYDGATDDQRGAPFAGFNHDEYLVFRIAVQDTLSPTPEPATYATLGIGLLAVAAAARRARRRARSLRVPI